MTDEILGGSLKLTFADQSFIVTAKFGTAITYGENLISDYYNSLAKKDNQMDYLVDGSGEERQSADKTEDTYVKDFVKGQYYDNTVAGVAKTYYGKVKTTIDAMKKDATVKEKIDAVKAVYDEAKTKIDEKYKKVIDAAVVKGGKNIDTLYVSGDSVKNMTTTDVAAMIKSAKADLAKATTLQEISKVIDKNTATSKGVLMGNYNEIERLRANAFTSIDATIASVYAADPSLNPGTTTASKEAYASFLAKLESFGITEDQLPTKVYENYKSQISAATTFNYYVKDDTTNYGTTTLAVEAQKAISDSSKNVTSVVRQAVLDSYYKEIDASSALTTEQAKIYCKGDVETAISTWFEYHSASGATLKASVTNFLSYDGSETTIGNNNDGGLYGIEKMLDTKYIAFNAERLTNKKTEAASEISAKAKEYIDSDTLYKSILSCTIGDEATTPDYATDALAATDFGVETTSVTALRSLGTVSTAGVPGADTYNLQKFVNAIVTNKSGKVLATGNDGGYIKSAATGVLALLQYKTTALGQLKTVYSQAVAKFKTEETSGLGGTTHSGYGEYALASSSVNLSTKITALFTTDDNVTTIHEKLGKSNSSNWVGLIDSLGAQYHDWWDEIQLYYGDTYSELGRATVSEVWKSIQAAVDSIIKGEITTYDQVKEVIDGLDDKFGLTVENYYASQLKALGDVKTTQVNLAADGVKGEVITNRYNNWVDVAGTGVFTFSSYSDVDYWYGKASADLKEAADLISASSEVDLAHKLNNAMVKAIGQVSDYKDTVKVGTAVLSETEKSLQDVKAVFNGMIRAIYACDDVAAVKAIIDTDTTGAYVPGSSYNATVIGTAVTNGKARAAALTLLEKYYGVAKAAVADTDANAKLGHLEALEIAYNAQVEAIKAASSSADYTAIIKVTTSGTVDTYTGTAFNLLSDASGALLTAYDTASTGYAATIAASTLRDYLIKYPNLSAKLLAVGTYSLPGTLSYKTVYESLYDTTIPTGATVPNGYIAKLDAIINA